MDITFCHLFNRSVERQKITFFSEAVELNTDWTVKKRGKLPSFFLLSFLLFKKKLVALSEKPWQTLAGADKPSLRCGGARPRRRRRETQKVWERNDVFPPRRSSRGAGADSSCHVVDWLLLDWLIYFSNRLLLPANADWLFCLLEVVGIVSAGEGGNGKRERQLQDRRPSSWDLKFKPNML